MRRFHQVTERIVSFVARQMLDVVSPANFLLTNPEVLETTWRGWNVSLRSAAEDTMHE